MIQVRGLSSKKNIHLVVVAWRGRDECLFVPPFVLTVRTLSCNNQSFLLSKGFPRNATLSLPSCLSIYYIIAWTWTALQQERLQLEWILALGWIARLDEENWQFPGLICWIGIIDFPSCPSWDSNMIWKSPKCTICFRSSWYAVTESEFLFLL